MAEDVPFVVELRDGVPCDDQAVMSVAAVSLRDRLRQRS
jgi:hypothetical protein